MNNELRIKPLLKYTVTLGYGDDTREETFTADTMVRDERDTLFYRTGNLIRLYSTDALLSRVLVTPVDDEIPE